MLIRPTPHESVFLCHPFGAGPGPKWRRSRAQMVQVPGPNGAGLIKEPVPAPRICILCVLLAQDPCEKTNLRQNGGKPAPGVSAGRGGERQDGGDSAHCVRSGPSHNLLRPLRFAPGTCILRAPPPILVRGWTSPPSCLSPPPPYTSYALFPVLCVKRVSAHTLRAEGERSGGNFPLAPGTALSHLKSPSPEGRDLGKGLRKGVGAEGPYSTKKAGRRPADFLWSIGESNP